MDKLHQSASNSQPSEECRDQISAIANSIIASIPAPMASTPAPKKRKHNTLTLSDKYGIILRLDQGESSSTLCREFNIGRSTLYDIKTNRAEIEKFVTSPSHALYDRKTLKKGDYPEVEEALYSWYTEEKTQIQVTGELLKEKGKYFFSMIHKRDDFQASEGWLDKFKKRFGIRLSSATIDNKEPIPADFVVPALVEVSLDYCNKFLSIVEQQKLIPDQVYFAFGGTIDCTHLPTSMCPPYSPQIRDISIMPCVNVTGNHKLDLLIVGNKIELSSINVATCVAQECVAVTALVLQEWYLEQFIPSVMKYFRKNNFPKKSLLVVANVSSFPDEGDMKIKTHDGLMDVMFVSEFSTDIFQNMGQELISTLRTIYKKRLIMDFLSKPFTRIDVMMRKYNVKDAVRNLAYSWRKLSLTKVANYWMQIWPAVAYSPEFRSLAGNADEDADFDAIISLFGSRHFSSSGSITPEELKAWLTIDVKSEPDDEELTDDLSPAAATVSCDDAISAANTLLQWAEQQCVDDLDVLTLKKLQEKALVNSIHSS